MMKCNFAMDRLITRVYRNGIAPYFSQRIWEKKTLDGNPFWGIGDFCGISVDGVIKYGRELTDLEWEGNELFFSHEERSCLEKEVVAAYLALKKQMEEEFSDWIFDLVVSIDEENHTGHIRFYNIRDGYHYINPEQENLDGFQKEALLVETVNEAHLRNYVPMLTEILKDIPVEIQSVEKSEIRIQDLASESHIDICWDDEEFTMYFDSFHCHYGEEEWDGLVDDVRNIIAGRLVAGRAESDGRWLGSYLLEPGNIPMSKSKLLKYLFGRQKEFYKQVQQNGGTFSVTAWDTKRNRTYLIQGNGIHEIEQTQNSV